MKEPIHTSLFELFKIGPGPSSSHTMAPMKAGKHFLESCRALPADLKQRARSLRITLFGSLSATGRGHATDRAVLAGLLGHAPEDCPRGLLARLGREDAPPPVIDLQPGNITIAPQHLIFDRQRTDLPWNNTLTLALLDDQQQPILEREYYSTGGGFIRWNGYTEPPRGQPCHPYANMKELKELMNTRGLRLVELLIDNERAITGTDEESIFARIDHLFEVMEHSVEAGLRTEGLLPGPLQYHRKAPAIHRRAKRLTGQPGHILLYLCAYALAVSEENADGQPIVTTPTCGSAGVLAATYYFMKHCLHVEKVPLQDAMVASALIGLLAKHNASIAGADVGCQGEVGVAAAMAAAMHTYATTSEVRVMENAAQTALEHHLGMTCDPVCGYVQIPCIERNALGAVKAYTAHLIASTEVSHYHRVDLDRTIQAMGQTGRDMSADYRETARGGLAALLHENQPSTPP